MKIHSKFSLYKKVAYALVLIMSFQAAFPASLPALTSGPSQPEFNSFEPVGTTQMVDLFSGDFVYNIPMFELPGPDGGYPFNLAYHSGISMDQEASWVGLGWTMNHGAINRTMRGFPDDFNGDEVERKTDMLPNRTWQINLNGDLEFWGFKAPTKKDPGSPGKLGLGLGIKIMHNSYKGWGMGMSTGLTSKFMKQKNFAFNGGFTLSANSFEGASLEPSLSLSSVKHKLGSLQSSFSINSREGIQSLSLGYSKKITIPENKETGKKAKNFTVSPSASFTFGKSSYSPQIGTEYRGINFTGSVKGGGYIAFAAIGGALGVSFYRQRLKDRNKWVKAPAFGYFNMASGLIGDNAMLDFNRENEGPIRLATPNLAVPQTTPDIYTIMGQGTGGMYRPYSSRVEVLSDPSQLSLSGGGRLGVEIDPGTGFDLGVDLGGNWGVSSSGKWSGTNGLFPGSGDEAYEPYYFKAAGEMTAELGNTYNYIGGDKAVHLKLGNRSNPFTRLNYDSGEKLVYQDGSEFDITQGARAERKPRANSIQPITKKELLGLGSQEALKEYQIKYYKSNAINSYDNPPGTVLARDVSVNDSHLAGMTSLQPNGMRYVYALPVMNKNQEETVFSVTPQSGCSPTYEGYTVTGGEVNYNISGSDEYFNRTKIPEYAHSYLLTSVLGADYVDLDGVAGPSDGDYGYWVKFNYVNTTNDYEWKTPFNGVNYMKGNIADGRDDKASFAYGSRQQFYLATAETRTHIAKFYIQKRGDGKGVSERYQKTADDFGESSYLLEKVDLFSKLGLESNSNIDPIKTVHFEYNHELCQNIPNNDGAVHCSCVTSNQGGKLTLKKVWFTYENSNRGSLSPYQFEYNNNPTYSDMYYDRWGAYRTPNDECDIADFPYTYQDGGSNISAWHLSKIKLPSGAAIDVNYESDDYGYVQDRVAMQMFKVKGVGGSGSNIMNPAEDPADGDLRVYFDLEPGETDINKYVHDLHGVSYNDDGTLNFTGSQVYFKILSDLNFSGADEYVTGYAEIDEVGVSGSEGWIQLKPIKLGTKHKKRNYHPFVGAAWQFLKVEYPGKVKPGSSLDNFGESDFLDALDEFASSIGEIGSIFKKYYKYCSNKGFGKKITLDRSFIRLNTPDRVKYGGGSRVQKVVLTDNWDVDGDGNLSNDTPTYGQVYDYTKEDEDGTIYSSGVAVNEPSIGYDECALRYAKKWAVEAFLKSSENMFFEYPINESYYPGASIGYSKVTVKTLATDMAMNPQNHGTLNLPNGFATTGVTINEFYTAKDFPTLVEETVLDKRVSDLPKISFTGVFNFSSDKYTGSQGYAITLNDMHGKPFKVTHLGLDGNNIPIEQKISEVVYTYAADDKEVYSVAGNKKIARVLNNEVDVLTYDGPGQVNALIEKKQLGVDYEFFLDTRESSSNSGEAFIGLNVDFTPPFIFGINGVPRLTVNESRTRTAVTNKIIRKTGILIKVDAYDGQSHVTTTNKVFDPISGEPLLTTVNNSFDNPIYAYNIPARLAYDRMGEAYKNWGLDFSGTINLNQDCGQFEISGISPSKQMLLVKGDECIITGFTSGDCQTYPDLCEDRKFVFTGFANGNALFENSDLLMNVENAGVNMLIVRSGRRNHLSAKTGNITALADPTKNRTLGNVNAGVITPYGGTINVPVSYGKIDSVLNANAVTYSDAWDLEREVSDTITVVVPPPMGELDCPCSDVECLVVSGSGPITGQCTEGVLWQITYTVNGGPEIVDGGEFTTYEEITLWCGYSQNQINVIEFIWGRNEPSCPSGSADYDFETQPGSGPNCIIQKRCLFFDGNESPSDPTVDIAGYDVTVTYDINGGPPITQETYVSTSQFSTVEIDCTCESDVINVLNVIEEPDPPTGTNGDISWFISVISGFNGDPGSAGGTGSVTKIPIEPQYSIGHKGIWRPHRNYAYVDERLANDKSSTSNVNLETDGVFNDLTLFNWENPFFLQATPADKWKQTSEITKYGRNGEEIENRDIVGLYSSALYGYKDNLPISVATNASFVEVGFEGFEEYSGTDISTAEENGHFDFECAATEKNTTLTYNILGGYNGSNAVWIDKKHYTNLPTPDDAFLILQDRFGNEYEAAAAVTSITGLSSAGFDVEFRGDVCRVNLGTVQSCELPPSTTFQGRVVLRWKNDFPGTTCNVLLQDFFAHTGKQSLQVNASTIFEQKSLQLETNRRYVFSAWMRKNLEVATHTYANNVDFVEIQMGTTTVAIDPSGEIIEGWQRMEGVFTYNGEPLEIALKVGNDIWYLDDMRIFPEDGSLQTYVYDPDNYRLKAVLDGNNYATFYHYDEEGNIFIIKKETAKGVQTVQETREYIKDSSM